MKIKPIIKSILNTLGLGYKRYYDKEIIDLNNVILGLKGDIDKFNQINKDKDYWNNKYPKRSVVYRGRTLPFDNKKFIKVPVSVFITPQDPFIIHDLKKWDLYQTGEDSETLIPKIYYKIKKEYYKYALDRNVWGKAEVWEFVFEMREKGFTKGFDCDSWSHFQASYYIAAGIPSYKVRVVCGRTDLGGHSTIYILGNDNKWHHLNSTYGIYRYDKVSKFPTHDDAYKGKDRIGISTVWFSFNNKFSWSKFGEVDINNLE